MLQRVSAYGLVAGLALGPFAPVWFPDHPAAGFLALHVGAVLTAVAVVLLVESRRTRAQPYVVFGIHFWVGPAYVAALVLFVAPWIDLEPL